MTNITQKPVIVFVTRKVKIGHETQFKLAIESLIDCASTFAGHLGGQLLCPEDNENAQTDRSQIYHVTFAFDTPEHLRAWQNSDERVRILNTVQPHIEGEQTAHQIEGMDTWFVANSSSPPRWKIAVMTWLGICPTVYVVSLFLGSLLSNWALFPRVMLITLLVVLLMTWVVAPRLSRLLRTWLHA